MERAILEAALGVHELATDALDGYTGSVCEHKALFPGSVGSPEYDGYSNDVSGLWAVWGRGVDEILRTTIIDVSVSLDDLTACM